MDRRYVTPFLDAIKDVFETMIDISFTLGRPGLKKEKAPSFEVSSIIGISGEMSGSVVINLSKETALELASGLLDEDLTDLDEDCIDAIGEVANMVAGNAKAGFPEKNTALSVPTVIVGKHKVNYPSAIPIISIPCETSKGKFNVDIALKKTKKS
jgi:chemotaxis protein CheX